MRSQIHLEKIDFALLREQKLDLINIAAECKAITPEQRSSIDGVILLLDYIQDTALEQDYDTKEVIFGPDTDEPTTAEVQKSNKVLSWGEFKEMPAGHIIAQGVTFNPILSRELEVRWVAVKGGGWDDWALYYESSTWLPEVVRSNGNKCTTESVIRSLVPCDDQVYARYRM